MAFPRQGLETTLNVMVKGMTEAAAKEAIVRVAIRERDRVLSSRGSARPNYRQFVDGILGAPLTSVRADGRVVFHWDYLGEVVRDTYDSLIARLPKRTGQLAQSVVMFVDGVEGTPDDFTNETKEVRIMVTADYARRIEVGRKRHSFAPFSFGGHHAVVETQQVAKSLYGQVAQITFAMSHISGAYSLKQSASLRRRYFTNGSWKTERTARRRFGQDETTVTYPTIVINPRRA